MSKSQLTPGAVTVLMAIYRGSDATELAATLDSLWSQTRLADEVLIVEDGPLTAELHGILDTHRTAHPELNTLVLARNQGLGPALQAGLASVSTEFLARLDTDDIAVPQRLARQLEWLKRHPETDVLGTSMQEFDDARWHATGELPQEGMKIRSLPETHDEIARYAKINSPVNHPSVMMRTVAVQRAGGYRAVHHMEDYDLWARMLASGARFHNLPEPLTYFRTSPAQFERRTGKGMFAAERQMQRNLVSYGLISRPRSWFNFTARTAYRLLPTGLLTAVYGRLFHR
ncbi:glycosyltransferase [Corynebacterium hylobatis]|uniref:Glycosyltransferase n=1 Tax=Corynebacterium hylobatis TaxID=1859290 RepID=A0A3S0BIK1_9CORY|nr:glycosyltransferase [Corynebacterium hylobatis]RSZ64395.1 glycosyltransferase [Corynebacterium hylobatis]